MNIIFYDYIYIKSDINNVLRFITHKILILIKKL